MRPANFLHLSMVSAIRPANFFQLSAVSAIRPANFLHLSVVSHVGMPIARLVNRDFDQLPLKFDERNPEGRFVIG